MSHHIHCNDLELDEDVFSAFPFLRFDARMPRKWFHKYQHMYMVRAQTLLAASPALSDMVTCSTRPGICVCRRCNASRLLHFCTEPLLLTLPLESKLRQLLIYLILSGCGHLLLTAVRWCASFKQTAGCFAVGDLPSSSAGVPARGLARACRESDQRHHPAWGQHL